MSSEEIERMRRDEPEKFSALVAEHVHEWEHLRQRRAGEWAGLPADVDAVTPVPDFSEPYHDYTTLVKARETWNRGQDVAGFRARLQRIWSKRSGCNSVDFSFNAFLYEPGDYSAAALAVALAG